MDLSVERKFASGLTFQSGYTLAKNQSDVGDDGERNTPEDPYNRARDFGNVMFMPRHRWVSNVLYDLPFGKGETVRFESEPFRKRGGGRLDGVGDFGRAIRAVPGCGLAAAWTF